MVRVTETRDAPGGPGNVTNNIVNLGAKASLLGAAGIDDSRKALEKSLDRAGIVYHLFDSEHPTVTKIRVIGEHQQVVRVDIEEQHAIAPPSLDGFEYALGRFLGGSNIVILSDYGKGFCSPEVCRLVIARSRKQGLDVLVDPKGKDWQKYSGAFMATPNLAELAEAAGEAVPNEDNAVQASGKKLLALCGFQYLLITRSSKGMSLISENQAVHIPTEAREVYDVSGAGDTVIATLATALSAAMDIMEATTLANRAAGIVVSKIGTAPIRISELESLFEIKENRKILRPEALTGVLEQLRKRKNRIAVMTGCFDVLSRIYVCNLRKAKELADTLIVGVSRHAMANRSNGIDEEPLNSLEDRMEVLAALEFVDYVVPFDGDTVLDLVRKILPDVLVVEGPVSERERPWREFARQIVNLTPEKQR